MIRDLEKALELLRERICPSKQRFILISPYCLGIDNRQLWYETMTREARWGYTITLDGHWRKE